jgi:hypothetical protein
VGLVPLELNNISNYEQSKIQFNTARFAKQFEKFPLFKGELLTDLQFLGTTARPLTQDVPHRLGRKPKGFLVTKINASAIVFLSSNDDLYYNDATIRLTASSASTFDLWIF